MKEVKLLVRDGAVQDLVNMFKQDKGLGDTVARFTQATGIKQMADMIPGGCGCKERQAVLNDWFPYKNNNNAK